MDGGSSCGRKSGLANNIITDTGGFVLCTVHILTEYAILYLI